MAVALLLADGFEEVEALTPLDVLRRAGVTVDTVGITGKSVTGGHGITVTADKTVTEAAVSDYDTVILPGGLLGTENLDKSPFTDEILGHITSSGGRIAAICAAPTILGRRGLLKGLRAVCYPGMEDALTGAVRDTAGVVTDKNVTTARGMGVALEFAKELVRLLVSDAAAEKISKSIAE